MVFEWIYANIFSTQVIFQMVEKGLSAKGVDNLSVFCFYDAEILNVENLEYGKMGTLH